MATLSKPPRASIAVRVLVRSGRLGSTFARTRRRKEAGEDVSVQQAVPFQVNTYPRWILAANLDHVQFGSGRKRFLRLEAGAWPAPQLQAIASDHDIAPRRKLHPRVNGARQL